MGLAATTTERGTGPVAVLVDRQIRYAVCREDNDPFWPPNHFDEHPFGEGGARFDVLIYPNRDAAPEFVKPSRRVIRLPESDLDGTTEDYQAHLLKVDMADFDANREARRIADDSAIFNKYDGTAVTWTEGSDDERAYLEHMLDTFQNAELTVGTSKTYATISAALTASSSGDIISCFATASNTYTENVNPGAKWLQIVGLVANQGLTITASSGIVVFFNNAGGTEGTLFSNFTVTGTGTATHAVRLDGGAVGSIVTRVAASGGTLAVFQAGHRGYFFENCLAYDGVIGFRFTTAGCIARHCTAVDNSTSGFEGTTAANAVCYLCIACDNGTDFVNAPAIGALNVSSDATAPGPGSSTSTFTRSEFNAPGSDDFSLDPAQAATTNARFAGYPMATVDMAGQTRKSLISGGNIVFAGMSDADPVLTAGPSQPDITALSNGSVTVAGVSGTCDIYQRVSAVTGNALTLLGSLSSDGALAFTPLAPGTYDVVAQNDGGASLLSLPDVAPLIVLAAAANVRSALNPIQKAVYALLTGDTTLMALVKGVFDEVPENQKFPYIALGEVTSTSFRTHGRHGENVLVTLHIWSQDRGTKESLDILDELNRLLVDVTDLTVEDFEFVGSWYEFAEPLREPDGETRHTVVRYRMRVQITQ